jgi:(p)ppGpp synthase/HD superfamily hydrolase
MTDLLARPSPRLDRAFQIANIVHAGAVRKGTQIPYIKHPVAVARILEEHGFGEDIIAAGLLHDTVEDAKYGSPDLQERLAKGAGRGRLAVPADAWEFRQSFLDFLADEFGPTVFGLVMAVTESKNDGKRHPDWLERKKEQLDHLGTASPDQAALKAADALHNITCTLDDVRREGLGVLDRFRGGALVAWHYSAVAQLAAARLPAGEPLAVAVRQAAEAFSATVRELRPAPGESLRYPPPSVY